jgi:hypothetical protein
VGLHVHRRPVLAGGPQTVLRREVQPHRASRRCLRVLLRRPVHQHRVAVSQRIQHDGPFGVGEDRSIDTARTIEGGIGRDLPQEAPGAFAEAIPEAGRA